MNIFEEVSEHFHHQAAPSFTPNAQPQESPVSSFDKIKHILTTADEDTIGVIDAILAHPEGVTALQTIAAVCGVNFPAGTVTAALSGAELVLKLWAQQPASAVPSAVLTSTSFSTTFPWA